MIDQPTMIGDVISQLIQLDIVSATTATALRHNPTEQVGNVHGFLDQLVGTGILTPFQRTVIGNGNAKSLRQGKYLLLDQIGEGGMGVVYKARHIRMERIVALKMLRSDRATNTDDLLRFRREVHTAAKLVHPNIVTAYDADECDGQNFLVMEYIEGQNLAQWARSTPRLPVALVLDAVSQVASGLQYAHDRGTVHRDIKPANLMRTHDGVVKILDLGLARMFASSSLDSAGGNLLQTEVGTILGTVAFMAPEQAEQPSVDAKADMYSLGCTLYFLLAGCPPYSAGTVLGLLDAHRSAPIPDLSMLRPGVWSGLQNVLNRMLAKLPQDRFSSMNELIVAIRDVDLDPLETVIADPIISDTAEEVVSTAENRNAVTRSLDSPVTPRVQSESTAPPANTHNRPASRTRWGRFAVLLILAGIVLKFLTRDGEVTVETSRKDLNVTVKGDRSVSIGTDGKPDLLNAVTSPEGMKVETGNVTTITRHFVLDPGTEGELRLKMTSPSDSTVAGVVGQAEFEQRLETIRKSDEWIAKWSNKLKTDSSDAMAQTCRGNRLNEIGQFDLAMYDHLEAVRKQPRLAIAWSNLAQSYVNLKQPEKALEAWSTAIQLESDNCTYRLNRADLLRKQDRLEEALSDLNAASKLPSRDIWVLANRADLLVVLNRRDEALKDLTEGTALNQSDPVGWVLRAQYYVGQDLPEEAIRDYSTALQLAPENQTWRVDRARCNMKLNRYSEAISDLNEAIRLQPGQSEWLQQRGMAFLKCGMYDKAVHDFSAAKKIDKSMHIPDEVREQVEAMLESGTGNHPAK